MLGRDRGFAALFAVIGACAPRTAPMGPPAPATPIAPDIKVITAEQAETAGLETSHATMTFDGGESGTEMIEKWLSVARARDIRYVGDLTVYIIVHRTERIECMSSFYPEGATVPTFVPGERRVVGVAKAVVRDVTRYEQKCVSRAITAGVGTQECRAVPVTRKETRWEYGEEVKYDPPKVTWLVDKHLRESDPSCYAAPEGSKTRVEGNLFRAPPGRPATP